MLLEYDEILTKTYSSKSSQLVLHQLAIVSNVIFTEPAFKWGLVLNDPDDNKFSDLAISCGCDYLVSNDTDFDVFKRIAFPELRVIDLISFLEVLRLQ
ncbi:putative toxin-antitoxin system toxin component, PIN family [Dyadobacter sp. CY345]|uniref:PIN domain-containing protein n=1 Tax=Dyadobacter sp. CY345 TaxID=2909335 RepID=UPI0038D42A4D